MNSYSALSHRHLPRVCVLWAPLVDSVSEQTLVNDSSANTAAAYSEETYEDRLAAL